MMGMKDDGEGRRSRGGASRAAGGGAWNGSWFVTIWLLQAAVGCTRPLCPDGPWDLRRGHRRCWRHTAASHARTGAHTHAKETKKQHQNTLSGGAANSTRQSKGGWRDGFPSRCCHGNDSGWRTTDFLYSCGAQREREREQERASEIGFLFSFFLIK